jgi:hypothetical protein
MSELLYITIWHPCHVFTLETRCHDLAAIRTLGRKIVQDIAAHDQAGTYETLYRWLARATNDDCRNDRIVV